MRGRKSTEVKSYPTLATPPVPLICWSNSATGCTTKSYHYFQGINFKLLNAYKKIKIYVDGFCNYFRWWKELNLLEKHPYARDRIEECYFFALAAHFEPKFASSRLLTAKYTALVRVLDDMYDSYATMDELRCFTMAIERFISYV